ncbi:MAG: DNA repair protein RadC [Planctomycetes bacterium]|nr:DNA repair protein RadC [Planctomycetota bacterium]
MDTRACHWSAPSPCWTEAAGRSGAQSAPCGAGDPQDGPDVARAPLAELLALVARGRVSADPRGLLAALAARDLAETARRSAPELAQCAGLSAEESQRIAAAFELGRRVERALPPVRAPMHAPALVHAVAAPLLRGLDREEFHAFLLDARHRLLRTVHVSTGTLSTSLVHPREVFAAAVREAAAAIVVVHNHPSGDPEPSAQDLEVTRRLLQAGLVLGVPLVDHVVIGADRWVSLRERIAWPAA